MAARITISVTILAIKSDFSTPTPHGRQIQPFLQMFNRAPQYSAHLDHNEDLLSVQIASCQSLRRSWRNFRL